MSSTNSLLLRELGKDDVLFGRGSGSNDNVGNHKFRRYVMERKQCYNATSVRAKKVQIAREVVNKVKECGGRFVTRLGAAELVRHGLGQGETVYQIVTSDETIMEKAKQALRQITAKEKESSSTFSGDVKPATGSSVPLPKPSVVAKAHVQAAIPKVSTSPIASLKREAPHASEENLAPPKRVASFNIEQDQTGRDHVRPSSSFAAGSPCAVTTMINAGRPFVSLIDQAVTESASMTDAVSDVGTVERAAKAQTVFDGHPGNNTNEKYVASPIFKALKATYEAKSIGRSHVVYAASSLGKTMAAKAFLRSFLARIQAPALMFSGETSGGDYLSFMGNRLGKEVEDRSWLKCLFAALRRCSSSTKLSPVLILDEFNEAGEGRVNIAIAKALARSVFQNELNFSIVFITNSLDMANELCSRSNWNIIGPLPGISDPERNTLLTGSSVPSSFTWKQFKWTPSLLTMVVLARFPELRGKAETNTAGHVTPFSWLHECLAPTQALELARSRLDRENETVRIAKASEEDEMKFLPPPP